jgi:hypothetical protein
MAHNCPECSLLCHCGGDIDDLVFEGTKYEAQCVHCDDEDDRSLDDEWDEYVASEEPA